MLTQNKQANIFSILYNKIPENPLKLISFQYLYNLSDERLIEETSLNFAYFYFLD